MPIHLQDSSGVNGGIAPTMSSFTVSMTGASDTQPDVDGSLNRSMGGFKVSFGDPTWPANSWFMTGGYQISNAGVQLVIEPYLTDNATKDLCVCQMHGPYTGTVTSFTGHYKNVKTINPNCKVGTYTSPSEVKKVESYVQGRVGWSTWTYELVNSGSRGNTQWYLRDENGNLVQSKFSSNNARMNWCLQFLDDNSLGLNYAEQFFSEFFAQASVVNANGLFLDYVDFIFLDVAPPRGQEVYEYSVSPLVEVRPDLNNDGSSDDDLDGEEIPADITDEDGYGGARMVRRGLVQWIPAFKNIWPPSMVLWRNSTRDGLDYSSGPLGDSIHPLDQSAFYQAWEGGVQENIMGAIGISKNDSTLEYDLNFNQVEVLTRYNARVKANLLPEGSHPWGRFGSHAIPLQFKMLNPNLLGGDWRTKDYEMARFITGITRLIGSMTALNIDNRFPFPNMDEDVFPVGDTTDGLPPTMGTLDPSVAVNDTNADYTFRSPDFESGGADFYWQQYNTADGLNKYIWVVRTDYAGSNVHGYGSDVACELPDPGSGKKWVHIDVTSTVTNGIRATRAQDTTLNAGQNVNAGGSFGAIDRKPAHSQLLVTTDA